MKWKSSQKIELDVSKEFRALHKDVQNYFIRNFNIDLTKKQLRDNLPKSIVTKSKDLLNILLNYLMEEAEDLLEPADTDLKNKFYAEKFREKVKEYFKFNPYSLNFSYDPRLINGGLAGAVTLPASYALMYRLFLTTNPPPLYSYNPVIAFLIVVLPVVLTTTVSYKMSAGKARKKLKKDVENHIGESEIQIKNWLNQIVDKFSTDFTKFCQENGFNIESRMINNE